jgi:TetR/AcrR family transcriptional regulator, repressor for neighboring sulfatase
MAERGKRVRRTPEEARRLILDAAQAAIARTGPEGLRLHDIAATAGVSHPLILHHFGNRAGLVRALIREASAELRDKLIAAMAEPNVPIEHQLDRVYEAFHNGLGQRLAWLATVDPDGKDAGSAMIQREIGERLHARRLAAAPAGAVVRREDSLFLVHLIATAALGEAIYGGQFRKSAGLPDTPETGEKFRAWLAALIRERPPPR